MKLLVTVTSFFERERGDTVKTELPLSELKIPERQKITGSPFFRVKATEESG